MCAFTNTKDCSSALIHKYYIHTYIILRYGLGIKSSLENDFNKHRIFSGNLKKVIMPIKFLKFNVILVKC